MATNEYKIILNNFGIEKLKPKEYKANGLHELKGNAGNYTVSEKEKGDMLNLTTAIKDTSMLGTPVFSRLVFLPGFYFMQKGLFQKVPIPYGGLSLDTVLISVSMTKEIKSEKVIGRAGSIKEYISDGDFSVNIKGTLTDPNSNRYPIEKVTLLRSICAAPEAIKVACDFLGLFLITHLVIESYSISQSEGYHNIQMFELNCKSDFPTEISVNTFI